MAIQLKFKCSEDINDFLTIEEHPDGGSICLIGKCDKTSIEYIFDIPTAIKFAKTLRTEINKAKEVNND